MTTPAGRRDVLADSILLSRSFLARYLAGFDDTNHTRQAPGLPNHAAWTMGHLAITMRRSAERLGDRPPPESDFITGDGRKGGGQRFDTESVSFGSKPIADPAFYPAWPRCVQIFETSLEHLSAFCRQTSESRLNQPVAWGSIQIPGHALMARMVFHNGMHCGQLADLRRAFGFKSVFV